MANFLFVAKFSQVSHNSKFEADKNGNLPYIGSVACGKAHGTLINGTIFENEGLIAGQQYLCESYVNKETGYPEVTVHGPVTIMELVQLRKELGDPMDLSRRQSDSTEDTVATATGNVVDEVATVNEDDLVDE